MEKEFAYFTYDSETPPVDVLAAFLAESKEMNEDLDLDAVILAAKVFFGAEEV